MNDLASRYSTLGPFWWSASIVAGLGAAWLLLQAVFVMFSDNAPQTAILLGVSLVIAGIPTLVVAACTLVYATRRKPSSDVFLNKWRAGIALSAFNLVAPLLAGMLLLAMRFGLL
jgi:succinate-acetate transporter protein